MVLADGIVVARHAEAQVALVFPQFVCLRMAFQAGEFQQEIPVAIRKVYQGEGSFGIFLAMVFLQPQRLSVECQAALQV